MEFFIKILNVLPAINNGLFASFDGFIESLNWADWVADAVIDCVHMLPFLLIVFVLVEVVEHYYFDKLKDISKFSTSVGPLIGALVATLPQCGFSIIAAGLYSQKLISLGTLLAVFLSTSDESIPVLLSSPKSFPLILPLIGTKILIAIVAGYLIDFVFKSRLKYIENDVEIDEHKHDKESYHDDYGCCHHNLTHSKIKDLLFHPICHTFSMFLFILLVTLILNYFAHINLDRIFVLNSYMQIIATSIIGLIPNCAASVAITLCFIKGSITFASAVSGLCTSSGLGLLVLLKNNLKFTFKFVILLCMVSILSGVLIQLLGL